MSQQNKTPLVPSYVQIITRFGIVRIKYKNWSPGKTWLPDGPGHQILNSKPWGIPSLVKPETHKLLDIKDLEESIKKVKTADKWEETVVVIIRRNNKSFCRKWTTTSADMQRKEERLEWQLDKLKQYRQTLENLLQKVNHFPVVSWMYIFN